MTKIERAACLLAATLAGCGGPPPSLGPPSPHGGSLFRLTDGRSTVEVVRRDAPDKPGQARLSLYFFDPGLKPKVPGPTVATLKPKERGARPVEFKPTGDADPARAGELAAAPFEAPGDVAGELSATVDGKPVTATINVR